MTVLLTGSAGFIGRRIHAALDAEGIEVRAVDRASGDDLLDPDAMARPLAGLGPDAVVCHQAAMVGMGVDPGDTTAFVRDNDLATAALLEALWRRGFAGRLVLASSMVVYGEGRYRCLLDGAVRPAPRRTADLDAGQFDPPCPRCGQPLAWDFVPEDAPLDPRSTYAATKVAQEHLAAAWARQTGATVVALRYHNVYGPGLPLGTPYAGVAALFRTSLERGDAPRVFEDGAQARDFVHVDDVARANVAAMRAGGFEPGSFHAFNVCSGRSVTVLEVAAALAEACRGPAPVVTGEYRLGDVRHVVASPMKAAAELGFTAAITLERGLTTMAPAGL